MSVFLGNTKYWEIKGHDVCNLYSNDLKKLCVKLYRDHASTHTHTSGHTQMINK